MSDPLTEADFAALFGFRYALRRFLAFSAEAAGGAGLTPQQHQALLAIRAGEGRELIVGALAERLLLRPHSATELVDRMDAAAATMDPVLTKFKNRVLFLKANLNAQAIASLKGTELEMSGDIDKLIAEMQKSIEEADQFIQGIQGKKG